MIFAPLQHRVVDAIKRHALSLSIGSSRAERRILTEYLWNEEGAESVAVSTLPKASPPWLEKLLSRQLEDERRHAELLRSRLRDLGVSLADIGPPPRLASLKLKWLERACRRYRSAFARGELVVVLAVAAQLEATGVRIFSRHLAVLEAREAELGSTDPTAAALREILADEVRHARSCAKALERVVQPEEMSSLEALRSEVRAIDRSFGVTISSAYWLVVASLAARDWWSR